VPKLVEEGAAHVTMLQRSPSFIVPVPADNVANVPYADRPAAAVRLFLGTGAATHRLLRCWKLFFDWLLLVLAACAPVLMKRHLLWIVKTYGGRFFRASASRAEARGRGGGGGGAGLRMQDFTPSYGVWEQRMCLSPDGDLFTALGTGRLEVLTARIETITRGGVQLHGRRDPLTADLLVTATGLNLVPVGFGSLKLTVDGEPYEPGGKLLYRGVAYAGLPNALIFVGYINQSWTLKVELAARYLSRVLRLMQAGGHSTFCATPDAATRDAAPDTAALTLQSGYIKRGRASLPRQGPSGTVWQLLNNYPLDWWRLCCARLEDGVMRFGSAGPSSARQVVGW
jgi:cation diffusion facilitator CzcD-associated flavoprotein CzcO